MIQRFARVVLTVVGISFSCELPAAEHVVLNAENWDAYAPAGKEVDCIYGDHVLRSDILVAVVADAVDTRNANLTVKGIGGSLIDLTQRGAQSDQLSCYYPHGGVYKIVGPIDWPVEMPAAEGAARLAFRLKPPADRLPSMSKCTIVVGYELEDGKDYLTVHSLVSNPTDSDETIDFADGIRADGEFDFGAHSGLDLWWCQDPFWRQAYGVIPEGEQWTVIDREAERRQPRQIQFANGSEATATLEPAESLVLTRRLFVASDTFGLLGAAAGHRATATGQVAVSVSDADGPVCCATVTATQDGKVVARGQTSKNGTLHASLPPGEYRWVVESKGRKNQGTTTNVAAGESATIDIQVPQLGKVAGKVTDGQGRAIPCRVAFFGQGIGDPSFGPDSAVHGVRNLWHTPDGEFEVELLPGQYEVVMSYGPEHDAAIETIEVDAGDTTRLSTQLHRSIDTTGWLSAELHSHSSPSGDNTSSQRGRVLNLLVDHLEFIPCTEHQRVSTYVPHLEHFGAMDRVLTCCGMELTGQPLPINHQNVFPLIHRPRTQDGGAPVIDVDPEVQIERIAMWDDASDKVVQINHPNIAQMIGDRDLNGEPDQGFRKMFAFADVIEVHPPAYIFQENAVGQDGWEGRGNAIKNWMQLLNLGYRIPGVVNTDAHWNYYGSGWLRNYVRSPSDDPAKANLMDVCHALERGQVVMTNGPFMEVEASTDGETVGPGDDLHAEGTVPRMKVRVQCPNWLDINRVQVFVNGRPDERFNFVRSHSAAGFGDGAVKFEREFELPLSVDGHVIVAAAAEGRQLGRVYGPEQGSEMPIAVSNPIFIDIDGQGFQANGDTLGMPLPVEAGHQPTHGHNHSHPHH